MISAAAKAGSYDALVNLCTLNLRGRYRSLQSSINRDKALRYSRRATAVQVSEGYFNYHIKPKIL